MSLDPALRARIESVLSANPVVLFLKGTPEAPQCGFSAKTAAARAWSVAVLANGRATAPAVRALAALILEAESLPPRTPSTAPVRQRATAHPHRVRPSLTRPRGVEAG